MKTPSVIKLPDLKQNENCISIKFINTLMRHNVSSKMKCMTSDWLITHRIPHVVDHASSQSRFATIIVLPTGKDIANDCWSITTKVRQQY